MSWAHVYLMHAGQFQTISVLGTKDLWIKLAFGDALKYMLRHLKFLKLFSPFSFSENIAFWVPVEVHPWYPTKVSQYSYHRCSTLILSQILQYTGRGLKILGLYLKADRVEMWQKHRAGTDVAPFPFQSICSPWIQSNEFILEWSKSQTQTPK